MTTNSIPSSLLVLPDSVQRAEAIRAGEPNAVSTDRSETPEPSAPAPSAKNTSGREDSSRRKKPTRTMVNFWLDSALLVVLLAHITAAGIVYLVFPVGTAAAGWQLCGLSYDQW